MEASKPVSPELLPAGENEEIGQRTEDLVGPYELHDFFLYHFIRYGETPQRLVEKDRANNPILVMVYRYNDEIWSCAGTLTESEIAAQYGGDYTRAAAEFYESARNAPQ